MSLLKTIRQQLGLSNTPANNFTLDASADNGTMKLARSSGQDILTVDNNGVVAAVQGIRGNVFSDTAKASTSGTSIDFTGIPSWAKRITVMFNGVSTSGTSPVQIQLGDSGGVETTGYAGTATYHITATNAGAMSSGFLVEPSPNASAAGVRNGQAVFSLLGGNTWVFLSGMGRSDNGSITLGFGSKTISDTLTQVRITTVNGTDTFDDGSINILYEG